MISKGILHHLAKFQISWPSFTVILGNFQNLEQDENFLEQVMRTVRTTFKGGQAFQFGKTDFDLGVGGEGQDTSGHFEGSFGSIRAILPM